MIILDFHLRPSQHRIISEPPLAGTSERSNTKRRYIAESQIEQPDTRISIGLFSHISTIFTFQNDNSRRATVLGLTVALFLSLIRTFVLQQLKNIIHFFTFVFNYRTPDTLQSKINLTGSVAMSSLR